MRSFTSAALPAIGLLLLLAELSIAAISKFHPRVDPYYASYYIKAERSCWLPPSAVKQATADLGTDHIAVPKLSATDGCFMLDGGWSNIEAWGVWSVAGKAGIALPVVPGRRSLTMTLLAFSPHNRQSVKISVDGGPPASFFVPAKILSRITLPVPAGAAGTLNIAITIKHPSSMLHGPDHRRLGIGLVAIDWH